MALPRVGALFHDRRRAMAQSECLARAMSRIAAAVAAVNLLPPASLKLPAHRVFLDSFMKQAAAICCTFGRPGTRLVHGCGHLNLHQFSVNFYEFC